MKKFPYQPGEEILLHGFVIAYQFTLEGAGYFWGTIGGPHTIQASKLSEDLQEKIVAVILEDIKEKDEGARKDAEV